MTARSMVNCILYRVDPETQYVENDTLDSLTVTAWHRLHHHQQPEEGTHLPATALCGGFHQADIQV